MAKKATKKNKGIKSKTSISKKSENYGMDVSFQRKVFLALIFAVVAFSLVVSFIFFTSENDYTIEDRFDTIEFFYNHCMINATDGEVLSDFDKRIKDQVKICEAIVSADNGLCSDLSSISPYDLFQEGICSNYTLIPKCFMSNDVNSVACTSVFQETSQKQLLSLVFSDALSASDCSVLDSTTLRSLCTAYALQDESEICSKYDKSKCDEYEGFLMLNAYLRRDESYCSKMPDMMHQTYCKAAIKQDLSQCEYEVKNLACRIEAVMLHMRNGGKEVDCDALYDENSRYFCNEIMGDAY